MILKKLGCGIDSLLLPTIPRGRRSVRKRGPRNKNATEEGEICAFELLASLAGKLLQESDSSASSGSSEANGSLAIGKDVIKAEFIYQGSCQNSVSFSTDTSERLPIGSLDMGNGCSPEDPTNIYVKQAAVSDIKLPLPRHSSYIKLGSRDDDEKFSGGNKTSSKLNSTRSPSRIADRRVRKFLNSRHWKVAPKLRDCEISRSDAGKRSLHRKRKTCYIRERCPRETLVKSRRFFDRRSGLTSDGGLSSESVSNSPEKGMSVDESGSAAELPGVAVHQTSFHSQYSHVKFSIKSFKVPELHIEVPENTTVGSLKRTVMEAVTAILGGGLRVGVLLHGKKIGDDNRTLLQTGLSCNDNIDNLGFTLEPDAPDQDPPPICSPDSLPLLACEAVSQLLTGSPGTPIVNSGISDALLDTQPTSSGNQSESNQEFILSHDEVLAAVKASQDSKAIVAVPEMNMEALAVVPMDQSTKCSKLVQRRTRRPFSVMEVEALVEAVEELGTGRWRDVKIRSFETADYRTYVDLKDKWKTLVHTARISPQQRRGEPVPQDLLDRVLAAHAYWSHHHGKHQGGILSITDASLHRFGSEGIESC